MYFIDQRIQVICNQLQNMRVRNSQSLNEWEYKKGLFFRPEEANADPAAWEKFHCGTDRWYAEYDGSDQVPGKFPGYSGDYRGLAGQHYWFRTHVTIPQEMDGESVWFRIQTQIEEWDDAKNPQFLVFVNGEVVQGADMNHREVRLFEKAVAGTEFDLDIQAYTGIMHQEFHFLANLFVLDTAIQQLYYDMQVPLWGFARMGENSQARMKLQEVLNEAVNLLDLRSPYTKEFYDSIAKAEELVQKKLYGELAGHDEVVASCIGHTHIDVAWWWTVAQTREKVVRSFSTVLKLMDEYPSYRFMSSQPVLYYFLKQRYPELHAKIQERVKDGRWEPEGAMWLEADCNLTSGESLVRQIIQGKRFFKEEFGRDNKILWLPDVFGYSAALPQILKKSGVDYFMTTKLAWNQTNKIPNDTFMWKGLDGTEVLTHLITTVDIGQNVYEKFFTTYNGQLHPDAIMGGWERYQNKNINNDILVCFGYGDGGGGPSRKMLETSKRMEKGIIGMPKVRQVPALQYFQELDQRVSGNPDLETWEGELYFEYHRGTYTSMARNKRGNRKSELGLMDLELLALLASKKMNYPQEELTHLWRDIVLLNQFHDILPGSSIAEVYEVTKKEYEELLSAVGGMIQDRLHALTAEGNGLTVYNTLGFTRNDVVSLGETDVKALRAADGKVYPVQKTENGAVAYVENLPAKGWQHFEAAEATVENPMARKDQFHLETPFYTIALDEKGHFTSIFDKENHREVLKDGKTGNVLRMYEDKPMYYDNWDIDCYYVQKSWPVEDLTSMVWTEDGPVRSTLELHYNCSRSSFVQKIHFYADTRRIDFETEIDWKEHQHLLKAEFPVDIHSDEATFEVQFGNVRRKVHQNTSWDKARFESCGQKWMDFSEGHYGVSLLNDCKYGHSVRNGVIGLTLIKSGVEPNPNTDVEMHYFTYSLYPHAEGWQDAKTVQEAYKLNQPAYAVAGGKDSYSFAHVDQRNILLETVKQAENGEGAVLRLYEYENARTEVTLHIPQEARKAYICDLLENPVQELPIENGVVHFTMKPYEIQSVLVK